MSTELKREAPISIYPPIVLYNSRDVEKIWEPVGELPSMDRAANLYVHIPFCAQRCDFCYFTSFSAGDSVVRRYVEALKKEIGLLSTKDIVKSKRFHTIYFGGGTPTYLKEQYLKDIIGEIRAKLAIDEDCEFCVEVRPGKEATADKLKTLLECGVNRISIGAQSFNQDVLEKNGRKHRLDDFFTVYERLRNVGFSNINIDIMSGMVGDTEESWRKTIDTVLGLAPENITVYKMHIYKSSGLYKKIAAAGKLDSFVSDETEKERIKYFYKRMEEAGYMISATPYTFTRSKAYDHAYRQSRVGGGELMGTGLSANSFMNRTAYQNTNDIEEYIERVGNGTLPIKSAYRLTAEEERKRALVFGLKTARIDRNAFRATYGIDPVEEQKESFDRMVKDGLAIITPEEIRLTEEAMLYTDDIVRKYILSERERQMEKLLVLHKNVKLKL